MLHYYILKYAFVDTMKLMRHELSLPAKFKEQFDYFFLSISHIKVGLDFRPQEFALVLHMLIAY